MDYAASILAKLPKRKRAIGLDRLLEQIAQHDALEAAEGMIGDSNERAFGWNFAYIAGPSGI